MNATEKILKAKIQLLLEQPFFATLVMKMQYVPDSATKTAITNGRQVKYNPAYVDQLTVDELKGVLAHVVMHTALLHHIRRNHRDNTKWNKATDYAINPLLLDSKLVLPEGYLFNQAFIGMSAEQIYGLLPSCQQNQQKAEKNDNNGDNNDIKPENTGNETGNTGDVQDAQADVSIQEMEAEMKQTLSQAALIAKRQGKLPAHLERLVTEVLQPKIDWRETLARFLTEIAKNDYTWKKPSSRYLHTGLYMPALESLETGSLILIADTSSSINEEILNQFAAEVQDIANTFNIPLLVIYVDAIVQGVQEIEPNEPLKLKPIGGGGTDFRPGFIYIEEKNLQPKAVLYLTDGACYNYPAEPDYPVLWAQFGKATFHPPFGEKIQVL
jgi:Uncharacterized protein conserved in bacteria